MDYLHQRLDRHREDIEANFNKNKAIVESTRQAFAATQSQIDTSNKNTTAHFEHIENSISRAQGLSDKSITGTHKRIAELENLVSTLASRLRDLEISRTINCDSCSSPLEEPVKNSHTKCKSCFLKLSPKICKKCCKVFDPRHHSYKFCTKCHSKTKKK